MSEKEEEPSVLGALPHSRPRRRSDKRVTRPAATEPAATEPAADPAADPATEPAAGAAPTPAPASAPAPGEGEQCGTGATELLTTVVQAAAELAEIGLMAGARALRIAVSRLPRP